MNWALIFECYESATLISSCAIAFLDLLVFLIRQIPTLNDAVVKLKLTHYAGCVHVTPVKWDIPSFDPISSLRAGEPLVNRVSARFRLRFHESLSRLYVASSAIDPGIFVSPITTIRCASPLEALWSIVSANGSLSTIPRETRQRHWLVAVIVLVVAVAG